MEVGDRFAEPSVARGVEDRLVEEVVRPHPDAFVLPRPSGAARDQRRYGLAKECLRLAEADEIAIADALGRQRRREALELGADLARGWSTDDRAAVRQQLDEARRLELPERLAHGRAADAELLGERLLPQTRPDRDGTAQHLRLNRAGDPFDGAHRS